MYKYCYSNKGAIYVKGVCGVQQGRIVPSPIKLANSQREV